MTESGHYLSPGVAQSKVSSEHRRRGRDIGAGWPCSLPVHGPRQTLAEANIPRANTLLQTFVNLTMT